LASHSDAEQADRPVIAGGGIAGLTLAITLARHGVRSVVLEARQTPGEAGAGIQLGPNAARILRDIGLLDALKTFAVSPEGIIVADAASGRQIAELPLGSWIEKCYGAPYLVVHRADLQAVLLKEATACPEIDLRFDCAVSEADISSRIPNDQAHPVTLLLHNGGAITAPVLVGADGVWSTLRGSVGGDAARLTYAGMTAARALLKAADLPMRLRRSATHVWLAPKAHIVMYPVRRGADVALVVITASPQPEQGWGVDVEHRTFLQAFTAMHPDIKAILQAAGNWKRWALFDPKPLPTWSKAQMTLIGDAAHPVLPFLAQGGAMAIEDAYVLGRLVAKAGPDPQLVFPAYEALRRKRVTRVQQASRENGRIYHMSGLMAKGRDLAMRSTPPGLLMQRYDWVYNWRYNPDLTA